jgi:twitching motility two-component system response regulator PilG
MQIDDMQSGTGTTVNERNLSQEDVVVTARTCRVMVVDDSKTIRRTAETLLRKEGFEVVTAVDGFEALGKIVDYQPDLVFLDIMMPRLDGYQTCALIKHHHAFRNTPVVMLSSRDGLFDRARGRVVGSDRYITKPFTKEELLAVIAHYVSNSG